MRPSPFHHLGLRGLRSAAAGFVALISLAPACGDSSGRMESNFVESPSTMDASVLQFTDAGDSCSDLRCKQVECAPGTKTTLSGTVLDPAGANPIYNAVVYVPNEKPEPFTDGASCSRCAGTATGSPIVSAVTDAEGHFVLENVPAGEHIPLVYQIGKWRRQITIPAVRACAPNAIANPELMHLPRNRGEGDIPKIAIATGKSDPFECLLAKIGLNPGEFTAPSGEGRVHFYQANGGANVDPPAPAAEKALWNNLETLKKYDIVLLPCEGDEYMKTKPMSARQAIVDYTSAGGRVFATHYGYTWIASGAAPFPTTGEWDVNHFDVADPVDVSIDTSFEKGKAFATWLHAVNATLTKGRLSVKEARRDINIAHAPAQAWMHTKTRDNGQSVQHLTFNTPFSAPEAEQCGRVVYSDFHVSAAERIGKTFPGSCKNSSMTAQEKALEFMLFDLSSCIEPGSAVVKPPK